MKDFGYSLAMTAIFAASFGVSALAIYWLASTGHLAHLVIASIGFWGLAKAVQHALFGGRHDV